MTDAKLRNSCPNISWTSTINAAMVTSAVKSVISQVILKKIFLLIRSLTRTQIQPLFVLIVGLLGLRPTEPNTSSSTLAKAWGIIKLKLFALLAQSPPPRATSVAIGLCAQKGWSTSGYRISQLSIVSNFFSLVCGQLQSKRRKKIVWALFEKNWF